MLHLHTPPQYKTLRLLTASAHTNGNNLHHHIRHAYIPRSVEQLNADSSLMYATCYKCHINAPPQLQQSALSAYFHTRILYITAYCDTIGYDKQLFDWTVKNLLVLT